MRHILIIMFMMLPLSASSQRLNIERVLDGRYKKNPHTTDVVYKGQHLFDLSIDYFHSLTVEDDEQLMDILAEAFSQDEKHAAYKEITKRGQHLFFGLYNMKYNGETNRFALFKDMRHAPSGRKKQVILIYMEGYCSIDKIKKMFKK